MPLQPLSAYGLVNNRPLIITRWLAIATQLFAILWGQFQLGFNIPVMPMLAVVLASFLLNLFAVFAHPSQSISERAAAWYFTLDIIQFTALLFFSGGIQNAFCKLMVVPLVLAASCLRAVYVLPLTLLSVSSLIFLYYFFIPIDWPDPQPVYNPLGRNLALYSNIIIMVFLTGIIWRAAVEKARMQRALNATNSALSRRRESLALGALAAAAVHELGSPLSTIAIIAGEMQKELPADHPLKKDADLLASESRRCRGILADLARRPERSEEMEMPVSLESLLYELVENSDDKPPEIAVTVTTQGDRNPMFKKTPALMYGLGNLVDNALAFAITRVDMTIRQNDQSIVLQICDDGPGFQEDILKSIGQPYISSRGYQTPHMGLGIFVAIQLLEQEGARLEFQNGPSHGACVIVMW